MNTPDKSGHPLSGKPSYRGRVTLPAAGHAVTTLLPPIRSVTIPLVAVGRSRRGGCRWKLKYADQYMIVSSPVSSYFLQQEVGISHEQLPYHLTGEPSKRILSKASYKSCNRSFSSVYIYKEMHEKKKND